MSCYVGTLLHFHHCGLPEPCAAIVTAINDDETHNLCVFGTCGEPYAKVNVKMVDSPTGDEDFDYCTTVSEKEGKASSKKETTPVKKEAPKESVSESAKKGFHS